MERKKMGWRQRWSGSQFMTGADHPGDWFPKSHATGQLGKQQNQARGSTLALKKQHKKRSHLDSLTRSERKPDVLQDAREAQSMWIVGRVILREGREDGKEDQLMHPLPEQGGTLGGHRQIYGKQGNKRYWEKLSFIQIGTSWTAVSHLMKCPVFLKCLCHLMSWNLKTITYIPKDVHC